MKKRNQTTSHAPVPQSTKATDAKKKKVTVDFCIHNLCIPNLKCLRSEKISFLVSMNRVSIAAAFTKKFK